MKVIYSNGNEGFLSVEQSRNLYIRNRFTKIAWEKLEIEMNRLDIINFEDPFLYQLCGEMVSIEYVRNQNAAH